MTRKPNLLFLWTDEQRADTLDCYGDTFIETPHLDGLAKRSFVFESAYCAQPVCTPSRASILTGQYPHAHGCIKNNTPLSAEKKTLAEMVSDEYHCAYYGKWHLGDEIVAQRGFAEWKSIEDGIYRAHYSRPEYLERRSDYHHFLVEQGFAPNSKAADGARVFSRNFAAALAEPYTKAGFLGREAARFLEAQNGERPFVLSVNFFEPHMPFSGPLNDRYEPDDLAVGPAFLQTPDQNTSLRNRLFAAQYHQNGHGSPLETEAQWRRVRANYCGLTTMVDNAIGNILRALENSGQADNTIIVFTSDHGDMMGDHALLAKCVMYEKSVRIPLLLHVPGLEHRRIGGNISQVDLLPTLLELMEQPHDPQLQGESRAKLLRGEGRALENDVVIEWNADDNLPTGNSAPEGFTREDVEQVRRQNWRTLVSCERIKINLSDDDLGELYDLNDDPHELNNRWDDARYFGRRNDLLARLKRWQSATGDKLSALLTSSNL